MNRWTGLGAAMLIQACGGLTYTYAVYSEHLKESLGYTQEQIDDVGAAKDFGYCIGIIGGLLYNLYPPWVTIAVGATLHFSGYLMVWLTVIKRISPVFWLLCTSIGVGVGGDSWMDTACMMTSLQNFSESRGTVVGLPKAQIGISGAIIVTIYKAYFKPDVDEYILIAAAVPALVSLLLAYCIRPLPTGPEDRPHAVTTRFQAAYGGILVLAMFLLVSITIQALISVERALLKLIAILAVVILAATCLVVVNRSVFLCASRQRKVRGLPHTTSQIVPPHDLETEADSQEQFLSKHSSRPVPPGQGPQNSKSATGKLLEGEDGSQEALVFISRTKVESDTLDQLHSNEAPESFAVEDKTHLYGRSACDNRLRPDFTLLLAFVMMTGPGSGLAVINNLAQMGQALFSKQVVLFVGLISIWSCLGRLGAGYGSDALVQAGYPRPTCLFLAQAALSAGCWLLSLGHAPLLYFASAVVGFCYGSFWALTPAVLSDVFGLTHFAAIYKTIASCSPVGAFLLSAKLIGYLYDKEVDKYHAQMGQGHESEGHICYGHACFQSSLRLLGAICVLGAGASLILTFRTQKIYSRS